MIGLLAAAAKVHPSYYTGGWSWHPVPGWGIRVDGALWYYLIWSLPFLMGAWGLGWLDTPQWVLRRRHARALARREAHRERLAGDGGG